MSSPDQKPGGAAAFPMQWTSERTPGEPGMTLRDYFAGQALVGVMGALVASSGGFPARVTLEDVHAAVGLADAVAEVMIEARGVK